MTEPSQKISIGMKERDLPQRPKPRQIPKQDRDGAAFCGPHGRKGRRLVAVVTKQGRLVTEDEDVDWVNPGRDAIMASCDLCPAGKASRQHLSVSALRSRLGTSPGRDVRIEDVLA